MFYLANLWSFSQMWRWWPIHTYDATPLNSLVASASYMWTGHNSDSQLLKAQAHAPFYFPIVDVAARRMRSNRYARWIYASPTCTLHSEIGVKRRRFDVSRSLAWKCAVSTFLLQHVPWLRTTYTWVADSEKISELVIEKKHVQ